MSYAGCHDNRMDKIWWNEQWMGWPIGSQYDASSNVVHARNLQGKLLLVVPELGRGEGLGRAAEQGPSLTARAQVAHPLGVTPRRDEVPLALDQRQGP